MRQVIDELYNNLKNVKSFLKNCKCTKIYFQNNDLYEVNGKMKLLYHNQLIYCVP